MLSEKKSENKDDIDTLLCNDIWGDYDDNGKDDDSRDPPAGTDEEDKKLMLRTRGARRHENAIVKFVTLACVLPGGLYEELDREWCVSAGGDLAMGGAVSAYRFNPYANTRPLSAAKQQEFQVRLLKASMGRLHRRSAADARKEERHQASYVLR